MPNAELKHMKIKHFNSRKRLSKASVLCSQYNARDYEFHNIELKSEVRT